MLNLDQFVYTTASINEKKGYQITAKSEGITDGLISQLKEYFLPIGVNTTEFKESKSLLILKKDKKIIFSKIKNIGIGYDGRNNTLYNHSLVMSLDDFALIDNDTRILENFYFEDYQIKGKISQLKIGSKKSDFDLEKSKWIEICRRYILTLLFTRQKIALLGTQNSDIIQEILVLLPPSLRLLSFSTLVSNVKKQKKYDIIIPSKSQQIEGFVLVDTRLPSLPFRIQKTIGKTMYYYNGLIANNQIEELKKIQSQFEMISNESIENKLVLVCNYSRFLLEKNKEKKFQYSEEILSILKELDKKNFPLLYEEIKESFKKCDFPFPDTERTAPYYDNFFLYPLNWFTGWK